MDLHDGARCDCKEPFGDIFTQKMFSFDWLTIAALVCRQLDIELQYTAAWSSVIYARVCVCSYSAQITPQAFDSPNCSEAAACNETMPLLLWRTLMTSSHSLWSQWEKTTHTHTHTHTHTQTHNLQECPKTQTDSGCCYVRREFGDSLDRPPKQSRPDFKRTCCPRL